MAQMTAHLELLLLMVLLGPLPAQRESRHNKFLRQHVDFPKTNGVLDARRYCNLMMQRRGMTTTICKPTNTFIHRPSTEVDSVCRDGGTHYDENYYDSNRPFAITTCRIIGSQTPPCNYRGRVTSQCIRLACLSGEPVHFRAAL